MRTYHYLSVITPGPLIVVRVPFPMPRWRDVLKAATPIMQSFGYRQKDISSIEGLLPRPDEEDYAERDLQFAARVERAFAGDPTCLPPFHLFDWRDGEFVLVREAAG